ncbi:ABC transporter permease [Pseudoneobacillus sp. C159]
MNLSSYALFRVLHSVPLLFIVSILSFLLLNLSSDNGFSFKSELPLYTQYFDWLNHVVHGDLGNSFLSFRPVFELIVERLPATLWLAGISFLVSLLIAFPLGIYTAVKKGSAVDYFFTTYFFIGYSVPPFLLSLICIIVFSLTLDWLPASGMRDNTTSFDLWDRLSHLILPTFVMAFSMVVYQVKHIRNNLLEQMKQEYVLTARAKGLSEWKVIGKHMLRNSILPFIILISMQFPSLLAGAFIIEYMFAWPGLGRLMIQSIVYKDFPVILGITMLTGIVVIFCNMISDILCAMIDPRIQR